MKNIRIAIRSLFKKGQYNLIKILSLALGLSVGLVLIAKVYFEKSYDTFYPDNHRIYQVFLEAEHNNEVDEYGNTSGGTVIAIKNEIPEVEAVTRVTMLQFKSPIVMENKSKYQATVVLADSCYMDLLPRTVYVGDPKKVLAQPMYAMVARSIADKIGTDVIGKTFSMEKYPDRVITIGGVFEDIPENSENRYDVLLSLSSISNFMWDGTLNYAGNERYYSYIKLYPDTDMNKVEKGLVDAFNKYAPVEELEKAGYKINFNLYPISEVHARWPEVKRMNILLALLAFALIFTAVMNYLLIVVSVILNRTKEIAVHKCYGANGWHIRNLAMAEALLHLLLAVGAGILLILAFRGKVTELIGISLEGLFFSKGAFLLISVCLLVFLITGIVAGYLYIHIPIASAFRNIRQNRRLWKQGLLATQFVAVGFLLTLLIIIGRQYTFMVEDTPGYQYENLAYLPLDGVPAEMRAKVADELKQIPEINRVSSFTQLPFNGQPGNNIAIQGREEQLFNIADLYFAGRNYLETMQIPIIAGNVFSESAGFTKEVMVDRRFVEKMKTVAGWDDDIVGKSIHITEHSQGSSDYFTICGVYENFRIGSIIGEDPRPSVLFYTPYPATNLLIDMHRLTPEGMKTVEDKVRQLLPDREVHLYSWDSEMRNLYNGSLHFRDAVMIGSIITLLIALIGLIGYTNDELNRRRKELAIRKVNGGSLQQIASIFFREILIIALPALITGTVAAIFVGNHWQQNFAEKLPISWMITASSVLFSLLIILSILFWRVWHETNQDPIEALKSE
ncbi:MAG: FtsX-like permease family protein [Bacteroidales bacterium]